MKIYQTVIVIFAAFIISAAVADPLDGISAYRGVDGTYSHSSKMNLQKMLRASAVNGEIAVWIAFDMPFVGNPELRTDDVVREEAALKEDLLDQIVEPLLRSRKAELLPVSEAVAGSPGCKLSVTHAGLKSLSRNQSVKYIGFVAVD